MRRSIRKVLVLTSAMLTWWGGQASADGGGGGGVPPPVITAVAVASPASTTQTTLVSMSATDPAGELSLRYSWTSSGPAVASFAINGSNAAKSTSVTFFAVGTYVLTGKATNAGGQSVSSAVTVTVTALQSGLAISPGVASVPKDTTLAFKASLVDQFGAPMGSPSALTWSVTGGGTIAADGTFLAGPTASGPFTVTASGGGYTVTTTVTVTEGIPPTIARPPTSTPASPVTVNSVGLDVLGADDGGEANLVYAWAAVGPGPVTFSANQSNLAKKTTAGFVQGGSYTLTVTVKDAAGLQNSSALTLQVVQKLAVVDVTPASVTLNAAGSKAFSAVVKDQFGQPMNIAPAAFHWTGTGGALTGALYTAGPRNGSFQVTATVVNVSGTAKVTVTGGVDGPPVTWISPSPDETVFGQVAFFVEVADPAATEVEFQLDGTRVSAATKSPWLANIDLRGIADGTHSMLAVVHGAGGSVAQSDPLTFEVNNSLSSRVTAADSCSASGASPLAWMFGLVGLFLVRRGRGQ